MKRLLVLSLAATMAITGVSVLPGCNGASNRAVQQLSSNKSEKGFKIKTLSRGNRTRKYAVFVPNIQAASGKYPAIIFLHGVGEGGSDSKKNLTVGLAPFVALRAADFPFVCIFPQSESGSWNENSEAATDVIAILDQAAREHPIDLDRVSLTGLSTGGYGTWAIGAKYRDRFAALVPMGSSENPSKHAPALVGMPIWSFHNSGDMFAATFNDSGMVHKIKTLGGNPQYTEYPAAGHNCWETAYGDGELFAWLLQQRRRPTTSAAPAARPGSSTVSVAPTPRPASAAVTGGSSGLISPQPAAGPAPIRTNASASINTPY